MDQKHETDSQFPVSVLKSKVKEVVVCCHKAALGDSHISSTLKKLKIQRLNLMKWLQMMDPGDV